MLFFSRFLLSLLQPYSCTFGLLTGSMLGAKEHPVTETRILLK